MKLFKSEVPEFTHQPLVQTTMQQETLNAYQPPCWVKGFCSLERGSRKQHERLHGMLLKEIRKQIDQNLPPAAAKGYLRSGDVAIVVRYGQVSSVGAAPCHSEVTLESSVCKVLMLASVSLRPASAVLLSMTIKPVKSLSIPSDVHEATFELDDDGHFMYQTSWEFVAYLLREQKAMERAVYISVLDHKPTFLDTECTMNFRSIDAIEFRLPKIDMATAVWPVAKRTGCAEDEEHEDPLDFVAQAAEKDWSPAILRLQKFMILALGTGDGSDEELMEHVAYPDALVELMEEVADISLGDSVDMEEGPDGSAESVQKGKPDSDLADLVVKAPLLGEIVRKGNEVLCGGSKCGTMSYLLHWNPAAIAANCAIHENCFVTSPLVGEVVSEDSLVHWLGQAFCFRSAAEHVSCAPLGTYHRRRPVGAASK
eukprot:s14_g19.t1